MKTEKKLIIAALLLINVIGNTATYYVAPWGNDTSSGSFEEPWATFQKAINAAQPGDIVYFRGGVYVSTERNTINPKDSKGHSGTSANPICYFGYPPDVAAGNMPVFDCSLHCGLLGEIYNSFLNLYYIEYIQFKDFEIRNIYQCAAVASAVISADYCRNLTFNHIVIHDVGAPRGFWILGGAWKSMNDKGLATDVPYYDTYTDTTRFINCDVYNLCDTIGGGNAGDAFFTAHYEGNYVLFDGCRAWNYSDDGWDVHLNDGAEIVFKDCWAMASDKYAVFDIEGNGWKISAAYYPIEIHGYTFTNCIAVHCPGVGFYNNIFVDYENYYSANSVFYNNTAYKCGIGFSDDSDISSPSTSIYKNNISYASTKKIAGSGDPFDFYSYYSYGLTESNNTWSYVPNSYPGFVIKYTVTDNDFVNINSVESLFTAPRQINGSLPTTRPLMLSSTSALINAGVDVGLPFFGSAPDLGASEFK
jgi:hypothetical protein